VAERDDHGLRSIEPAQRAAAVLDGDGRREQAAIVLRNSVAEVWKPCGSSGSLASHRLRATEFDRMGYEALTLLKKGRSPGSAPITTSAGLALG
jgi:hypothetical protein